MGKYLLPRLRLIRKFGPLPGLSQKLLKHRYKTPGQHGKIFFINELSSSKDDYLEALKEKQRLRFNFGLREKHMYKYFLTAKKNSFKKQSLLNLLESRLDTLIFRAGFTITIPSARQLVSHGHIKVNNQKVTIPSFQCKKGDIITVKERLSSKTLINKFIKEGQISIESLTTRKDKYLLQSFTTKLQKVPLAKLQVKLGIPSYLTSNFQIPSIKVISNISGNETHVGINESKILRYYIKY